MVDSPIDLAGRYSKLDRVLHRLAFSTIEAQKALSDIEDKLFAGRIAQVEIDRPVFITSLPRAGTTLLLEVIHLVETFAAHSYRNMPFLLVPLLWNAISNRFRIYGSDVARAHDDGMTVGYDSVEAFEEVIWHAFWPQKYKADRIAPWSANDSDPSGEFEEFIENHIRKLIVLRSSDNSVRYISKNNVNLSRIPKLVRMFPNAIVLVPCRNPVDHVGSMLRQHLNFKAIHAKDQFAKQYMKDTCHFDFGATFTPIDFANWLDQPHLEPPEAASMWLKYWCAAFRHVLREANDRVVFVSYDACCANPIQGLNRIADRIGLDGPQRRILIGQAGRFRPSTHYDADALGLDRATLEEAFAIYSKLMVRASL